MKSKKLLKCPYKKKALRNSKGFFYVGRLGLEPRKTAPKTVVLPLHHRPSFEMWCKSKVFFFNTKKKIKKKRRKNSALL